MPVEEPVNYGFENLGLLDLMQMGRIRYDCHSGIREGGLIIPYGFYAGLVMISAYQQNRNANFVQLGQQI